MSAPHIIHPEFASAPWQDVPDAALQPANTVPTMLHWHEQKLYYWMTRHQAGGPGAVVDLGAFVGGSTARLAQGMADRGQAGTIHAYDRFTASDDAKAEHLYPHGIARFDSKNTLPLVRQLLAPWGDQIRLHPGDIRDAHWGAENGPIALLILDACKLPPVTDHIAETFFPHLVAGQSIINHQDVLHWSQVWLVPQMMMLADFFEPLAFVRSTSIMYRCTRVPSAADLAACRVEGLDDRQLIAAITEAKRRFSGWDIDKKLDRLIKAVRLNPGTRKPWDMTMSPRRG